MFCSNCGKVMVSGTVQNITMHQMMLVFNKNGEEKRLRDLFKKDQIGAMVLAEVRQKRFIVMNVRKS